MAKKNGQTGGEDSPVKANPLEDRHAQLREERRVIEAELASIDGQVRQAINDGELEALDKLTARRAELPRLYIAASTAETKARQEIANAEDQANLKRLKAAEGTRDDLQTALVELRARHEKEVAALMDELNNAVAEVGAAYATIQASRGLGSTCDAGFKRAMAAITGV